MSQRRLEWIVLMRDVQPPTLWCQRCNGRREIHLPAAISDFALQIKAFQKSHDACSAQPAPGGP